MSRARIEAARAEIDSAIAKKFRLRDGTLEQKMSKAGRRLPRIVRDNVAYLQELDALAGHPKRRAQVRLTDIDKAKRKSLRALGKVDVSRDRMRDRINWLGVLVINLMLFGVAYFALLRWLGAI